MTSRSTEVRRGTVPSAKSRLRSLDGLRGIAAAVVVLYHLTLIRPSVAGYLYDLDLPAPRVGTVDWFLLCTPLKLATSGTEAVVVFFVLSGYVLTRAVRQPESGYDWMGYFPRRLVRLLVPVGAAITIAALVVVMSRQDPDRVGSLWLKMDSVKDLHASQVVLDLDLLFGPGTLVNPVWSLRYELLFSLLLPVYALGARLATRRAAPVSSAAAVVVCGLGAVSGSPTFTYLPMFFAGAMLVHLLPLARAAVDRLASRSRRFWLITGAVLALTLLDLRWLLWAIGVDARMSIWIGTPTSLVGAALLVVLAAIWSPLVRTLDTRPAQHLGRVSFSLYLVHVPVIYALANLLSGTSLAVIAAISFLVIVAASEIFSRLIEIPAHRLSHRVGRAASRLAGSWAA